MSGAQQGRGADGLQRPLVPRSRFQPQLTPGVGRIMQSKITALARVALASLCLSACDREWRSPFRLDAFRIGSEGMAPTLLPGDAFLVDQLAYKRSNPQGGDVVIFRARVVGKGIAPLDRSADGREDQFVMRILGVPGDVVEFRSGVPLIAGSAAETEALGERWKGADGVERLIFREELGTRRHLIARMPSDGRDFPPMAVEPGRYFVVGDNRDNSLDSRYWGTIRADDIIGKAGRIYFSSDLSRLGLAIE